MKRNLITIWLIVITTATTFCSANSQAQQTDLKKLPKGQKLFTKFSLFYEGDTHLTTNYRRGLLLPANTEVKFVRATKSKIIVEKSSGDRVTIENVEAYSGEDIKGIFERTLSTGKANLEQFTDFERQAIAEGQVKIGMSKAAVLVALGYPPKHKTPSLEGSNWRYWSSRFGTFLVVFEHGKVLEIRN